MSTTTIVSSDYTFADLECSMNSLLVFIKPENFSIDVFLMNQFKEKEVLQVQVISCTNDKMFFFGLITYINKKAAAAAMEHFRSIGIFTQCVTLYKSNDKMDTLEGKPEKIDVPIKTDVSKDQSLMSKVAKEEPIVLPKSFEIKCIDIFELFQNTNNLDLAIHQLRNDPLISHYYEMLVSSLILKGLSDGPKVLEEMGMFFVKILLKRVFPVESFNEGINNVLMKWTDYILDFPHFFSNIASIVAPLIMTCEVYGMNELKAAFQRTSPDVSTVLIVELLKAIVEFPGQCDDDVNYYGIARLFKKWTITEYTSIDTFVPCEQLNKYFKRDQLGVFLLAISIYDQMLDTEPLKMYPAIKDWIENNIKKHIIDDPLFVRALSIAAVFISIKKSIPFSKFFNYLTGELLVYYIKAKPIETFKVQAREVQCLYGVHIAAEVVSNSPRDFVFKLLAILHRETIVTSKAFNAWKDETQLNAEFIDDLESKKKALESFDWNDLLAKFATYKCYD